MQRLPVRASRPLTLWFQCGLSAGLAVLLWLVGGALVAQATDRCVEPTGAGGCYTTIQAAVTAAASGDTISIAGGTYNGPVNVTRKNLSFVGAGRDQTFVDGGGANQGFHADGNSRLELSNLTVQNGRVTNTYGAGIYAGAALTLTNVDVLSNTATLSGGGGVFAGGMLVLSNTLFISNTAAGGGGGAYANADANVTSGRFEHNASLGTSVGGGLVTSGSVTVTGTQFISNTAYGGGGISANGDGVLNGVLFQDNRADSFAGLTLDGNAALRDTDFYSNTATGAGSGGAYVSKNVQISGGHFLGNSCGAGCYGGALTVKTGTIAGTVFVSNTGPAAGGALYVGGTSATTAVTVTNAYFERNVCTAASCIGGGMYANAPVALVDTDFYSNTGGTGNSGGGGGLQAPAGATVSGGQFRYNTAFNGGALSAGAGTNISFVISGTQFFSNTASPTGTGGGAIYFNANSGSWAWLVNVYAVGNSAKGGGAIYTGRTMTVTDSVFENNSAFDGGAVAEGGSNLVSLVISGTRFISNTGVLTSTGGGALYFGATSNGSSALLTNVYAANNSAKAGGAIYASKPISVSGGIFENNTALNGSGGGLYGSDVISVTGAMLLNNAAVGATSYGGGIYQTGSTGQIVNTLLAGNSAGTNGDGYYRASSGGPVRILNSTFAAPTVPGGTAIYINNGTVQITNTLVSSYTNGIQRVSGTVTADYNLFAAVTNPISGTVGGGTHDVSSTDAHFVDPTSGNYRLLTGSPAAGKGTNVGVPVDLDGKTRADPPAIGAYEGTAAPGGLSLVKAVSLTSAVPFQGTVVYTLTLANGSAQNDPNAMITDTLPAGVTFQSWIQQPAGAVRSGSAITWTGTLANAAQVALVFAATNTASGGVTITNTAGFSGTGNAGAVSAAYTTAADCYAASSGNWSVVFAACASGRKRIIPPGVAVTLDMDVTLTGDFEVQSGGTFTPNGKTMTLAGVAAQTLTGNPLTFYKLVLNKDNKSDIVRIVGKLVVTKKLTITKGSLISASEYGDLEIEALGALTLTNPISITGSFTNSGDLHTDGQAVNFTGGMAVPAQQNLVLNVMTWFDDLNVLTGTTLVEAITDDNAYLGGVLTNYGTIRKIQPIAVATQYSFGLAGEYAGADLEVDAAVVGSLSALQVDRIDASPTSAPGETPLYWQITPVGADYNVTLTLPHNGLASPYACRRVAGSQWDCARSEFDSTTVVRQNVTQLSDWGAFAVQPLAVNDGAGTLQDTPVTAYVLANDLDRLGLGLTVTAITLQPVNGIALPTGDRKAVLYTPNAGFSGQDTFMYVAEDANGNSDDAMATIVVAPKSQVDVPPQIAPVDPQVEITTPFSGTTAQVEVQIPAGFITQTLEDKEILFLSYTPAMTPTEETTTPPSNLKFGNFEFDLTLFLDNEPQHGVQFAVPITVTIAYNPVVVAGLKEETLEVFYWDGTAWITSGITVISRDLVNHIITISLAHLSQFGFFAQKTPTDLDQVDEPNQNIRLYLPGVLRELTPADPVEQPTEQPTEQPVDQSPEQNADLDAVKQMYLPLLNK